MMITKRKPYVREMKAYGGRAAGFYKFYMFREMTAVPAVWFSIVVLIGVFSLRSLESWAGFIGFLQNPLVMLLNIITLVMGVVHTKTLLTLLPKAVNIVKGDEKMSPKPMITGLWAVTAVVTVIILAVALV